MNKVCVLNKYGLFIAILFLIFVSTIFLASPKRVYAGWCDCYHDDPMPSCTNNGQCCPACSPSSSCPTGHSGGYWSGNCSSGGGGGGGGGGTCYQSSALTNTYTVGSCSVAITHLAWDTSDGNIGGYKDTANNSTTRKVAVNDSGLDCKTDTNLAFTNDWGASSGKTFSITTTINSKSAGNSLGAGWQLNASGCTINGTNQVGPTQVVTDSGSSTQTFTLANFCGDGVCSGGETFSSCPTDCPAPTPTAIPTPTSIPSPSNVTWTINATPVCANGNTPNGNTRIFYALWPPGNPITWHTDTLAPGIHTVQITGDTAANTSAYVGMDRGGALPGLYSAVVIGSPAPSTSQTNPQEITALQPIGTPPNSLITYGAVFNPPTLMAKWTRSALPSGTYNMQFQAPDSMCTPPTPTAPPAPAHTVSFRIAESKSGLDSAPDKSYTGDGMTTSHTFNDKTLGVKTLWVRFIDDKGTTRDASMNITLASLACNDFSIAGLNKTGMNSAGGSVYTADNAGSNNFLNITRTPANSSVNISSPINADSGSAANAPQLTVSTTNPGTGQVWVANIPPDTSTTTDNAYTVRATVGSGDSSISCLPITVKVPKAQPGATCNYSSTEVKFRSTINDPWLTEKTINKGDSVYITGFHNNTVSGPIPADAILKAAGPHGETVDISGNNVQFTPTQAGMYVITATTQGQTGNGCTSSSNLMVNDQSTLACKSVSIEGLSQTDTNSQGGPVYSADSAGSNRFITINRTPPTADVNISTSTDQGSAGSLGITKRDPGTGPVWIANIPSNNDIGRENSYTINTTVSSGNQSVQCAPVTVKVSRGQAGNCSAYSSTEVKLRKNPGDPWLTEQTINQGDSVYVTGFHNGGTSNVPTDVTLRAAGPHGESVDISGNNIQFAPRQAGVYLITASTQGQTGSACTSTSTLNVQPAQVTTVSYRIAESEQDLNNAPDIPYSNFENQPPITTPYTFKDKTPGIKKLFVRFTDSTGITRNVSQIIRLLAPDPSISSIDCHFSPTGTGTNFVIKGAYLGKHANGKLGKITIGGKDIDEANIISWDQSKEASLSSIVVKTDDQPSGKVPVSVTIDDGRTTPVSRCILNTTTVDFTAKNSCRTGDFSAQNVNMLMIEATSGAKPFARLKINIDKDGSPVNFTPVLEANKKYSLFIKELGALTKRVDFTADSGTTTLQDISLPVGDIAPLGSPDGVINSNDYRELVREWASGTDVTRAADLNDDGRVNSLDYSCLRQNFNKSDDALPGQ